MNRWKSFIIVFVTLIPSLLFAQQAGIGSKQSQLAKEVIVTVNTSTVTITGLDGNKAGGYEFEIVLNNSSGSPTDYYLFINSDMNGLHYWYDVIYTGGTWSSNTSNSAKFTYATIPGSFSHVRGSITGDANGYISTEHRQRRFSDYYLFITSTQCTAALGNLTSLTFVSQLPNAIGAGSRFRLWRRW